MGCAENCTGTAAAAPAVSVQPEKPFLAVTHCHLLEQKGPTMVPPHSLLRLYPQKNQVAIMVFRGDFPLPASQHSCHRASSGLLLDLQNINACSLHQTQKRWADGFPFPWIPPSPTQTDRRSQPPLFGKHKVFLKCLCQQLLDAART